MCPVSGSHCACDCCYMFVCIFFFNDTATTEIYTYYTLFPYTTLFRSRPPSPRHQARRRDDAASAQGLPAAVDVRPGGTNIAAVGRAGVRANQDRKSTRLNSSH